MCWSWKFLPSLHHPTNQSVTHVQLISQSNNTSVNHHWIKSCALVPNSNFIHSPTNQPTNQPICHPCSINQSITVNQPSVPKYSPVLWSPSGQEPRGWGPTSRGVGQCPGYCSWPLAICPPWEPEDRGKWPSCVIKHDMMQVWFIYCLWWRGT